MGSGLTITGWDDEHPSQQTNTIRIRNNEFSDYSWSWGGSGYFMLFDNQPRNVTLDHNTLISGQPASGMIAMAGSYSSSDTSDRRRSRLSAVPSDSAGRT